METNCFTPLPINCNCWKHHAGFIAKQIISIKGFSDIDQLKTFMPRIGESQMDLYFGNYSVEEISKQLLVHLQENKIFSSHDYQNWLGNEGKHYQLVELKDRSIWTLRLSESSERYVHIHPGRYSPHTVRVKAATLKTVIMILALGKLKGITAVNIETVNGVRKKYLNEPPLKSISKASALVRLLALFQNFF